MHWRTFDFLTIFFALFFCGLIVRLAIIEVRPVHHDEGVNGYFVDQVLTPNKSRYSECLAKGESALACFILNSNTWRYDYENYHGPAPFYMMAVSVLVFGENIFAMRLVPAILGAIISLFVLLFRKQLGTIGSLVACFFLLFSPALLYYSLDAIHEYFFAFFAFGSLCLLLKFAECFESKYLYFGFAFLALTFTTKEASFLTVPAIIAIAFFVFLANACEKKVCLSQKLYNKIIIMILISFFIFATIFITLFSSLFANMRGVIDAFKSPFVWTERMTGQSGHEKVWYYYFDLIGFSEIAMFFLAIVGIFIAIYRKNLIMAAFAAFFIFFIVGASVPAYKVPWGLITALPPLAILAGYCAEEIYKALPKKKELLIFFAVLICIAMASTLHRSIIINTEKSESEDNKLAYVQTKFSTTYALKRVEALGRKDVNVAVISSQSTWPLPWLLKRYNTSYYDGETLGIFEISSYDLVIVEKIYDYKIPDSEKSAFYKDEISLRPGMEMFAYFKKEVFK
ncbi:MAG: TIGR03663 family protein [Candidatus Diapherotrites archaeon]|nr:TIGR03663 family protein [Candidatus Diapherotrites archaeon]